MVISQQLILRHWSNVQHHDGQHDIPVTLSLQIPENGWRSSAGKKGIMYNACL